MGKIYVTDLDQPKSALAFVGCFGFYVGEPDRELVRNKPNGLTILVPQSEAWARLIEEFHPSAKRFTRYAIKKNTSFDRVMLQNEIGKLPPLDTSCKK